MLHIKNKPPGKHAALQATLLCSVSVIAWSVILVPPPAARAQVYNSNQASTVNSTGANI